MGKRWILALPVALALAGCGGSATIVTYRPPTDRQELAQACASPPASTPSAVDYGYETVDPTGQITGIANCDSGYHTVALPWVQTPRGSGDTVYVYSVSE